MTNPTPTVGTRMFMMPYDPVQPEPDDAGWEEIGGIRNFGELQRAWGEVRSNTVTRRLEILNKGGLPAPMMQMTLEYDAEETSHETLEEAFNDVSKYDWWFKIELNDAPPATAPDSSTPTYLIFGGKVMTLSGPILGGLENDVTRNFGVGVNLNTYVEIPFTFTAG